MSILILAPPDDPHAEAVRGQLRKLGARFTSFSFDRLSEVEISVNVDRDGSQFILASAQGETLDLSTISAVWFRRPGTIRYSGLPESWMNRMVESELSATVIGALRTLDCFFVNHPARDAECSYKLWQLKMARSAGFIVPDSLITNSPNRARDFFEKCNQQMIYKLIGEGTTFCLPKFESPAGIPTMPFTQSDLDHLEQVALAPHFFQQCIQKQYDIRVTAIGKRLFAIKIDSQAGEGTIDWRKDYTVAMEPITLPNQVAAACLTLLGQLGLNYGAIDLALDADGNYVFFEINCAGQFLWIEKHWPILSELAKLLTGDGEPIVAAGSKSRTETMQ